MMHSPPHGRSICSQSNHRLAASELPADPASPHEPPTGKFHGGIGLDTSGSTVAPRILIHAQQQLGGTGTNLIMRERPPSVDAQALFASYNSTLGP